MSQRRMYTTLASLRQALFRSGRQQVRVLTYAGSFEPQRDPLGRSASFDAYLRYAASNSALKLVAVSTIDSTTAMDVTQSTAQHHDSIHRFHVKILNSTIAVAKRLIELRLVMR